MPMYVFLKGGIQPCDECKKIGIAVVEVKSDADRELTGRRWLMKKEAIKKILADDSMLSSVFQKRIMFISEQPWMLFDTYVYLMVLYLRMSTPPVSSNACFWICWWPLHNMKWKWPRNGFATKLRNVPGKGDSVRACCRWSAKKIRIRINLSLFPCTRFRTRRKSPFCSYFSRFFNGKIMKIKKRYSELKIQKIASR